MRRGNECCVFFWVSWGFQKWVAFSDTEISCGWVVNEVGWFAWYFKSSLWLYSRRQFLSQNFDIVVFVWDISMDEGCLKWHRFVESATRIGAKEAQVEAPCAISKLLFYGMRFRALVHVFTLFSVLRILEVSFFPGVSYQTLNLSWVVNHQVMAWFYFFQIAWLYVP